MNEMRLQPGRTEWCEKNYLAAALNFAQRAFCARRIAARPLALMGRRLLLFAGAVFPDLL